MLLHKLSSIITASLLLGGRVTARKDDNYQISHLRGNGNEITFTASSASLPPEEQEQPSVKIRTMPNSPFRIFTRQGTSNTARDDNNNNDDEIVEQISVWDSTTNTTIQYNIPPPKSPPLELEYDNEDLLLPPCPETYNPQQITNYVVGDKVEVYDTIFTCRPSPYEEYCNIHSLEEAILLSKSGDYIATTTISKLRTTGFNNNQDGDMNSNSQQQQLSEEEQVVTELWLNAWMEVGKCIHSTTITMPEQEQNTAAASTEPTVLPTYWPTYSPSNYFPTALPTSIPTDSPSYTPSNSPLALSPNAYDTHNNNNDNNQQDLTTTQIINEQPLIQCNPTTQIHIRIIIQTDNYPQDTSFQFIDRSANVILVSSPVNGYMGIPLGDGSGRMASKLDVREICLDIVADANTVNEDRDDAAVVIRTMNNKYEFAIYDKYGDGICCRPDGEHGYYKVLLLLQKNDISTTTITDPDEMWQVLAAGSNFKKNAIHHHFELSNQLTAINDIDKEDRITTNNAASSSSLLQLVCPHPQRKITIQVQTDNYGEDIAWSFRLQNGDNKPILAKNERNYENNRIHVDERDVCVDDSSLYELTIEDDYGDGLRNPTSKSGPYVRRGHYKIFTHRASDALLDMDRETILHGGYFMGEKITHLINTTLPSLTDRDEMWLYEHNKRRKYWHAYYNTSYISLQWSESLKAEAKIWADHLLDHCDEGIYHDPDRIHGENAAANQGTGSWGTKREPEKILKRFVEYEVDWNWPDNGHLTQALWRASKYVGCAESHRERSLVGERKYNCHTQVCRYARTGNCNMGAFKNEDGSIDYVTPMLEDDNYCGPICPDGGCHA